MGFSMELQQGDTHKCEYTYIQPRKLNELA